MGRIFGTDGVRGVAGVELTAQLAMDLAVAAVPVLAPVAAASGHARRPSAVIGRDSRASGDFLEAAVVAGLASSGVDVLRLGVIPTPGVAYLTGALDADFGVVLSASHNPAADNGIKFFGRSGVKLPDEIEDEIEARLFPAGGTTPRTSRESRPSGPKAETAVVSDPPAETGSPWVSAYGFGRVTDAYSAHETYLDHLLASLPTPATGQSPLHGMRVVVDCAHGAAYSIGPRALRRAGAEVIAIGAAPDGLNINASVGSTHLETLAAAVLEHGADAGLAFDGDADRCLAIDGNGQPLDGDQILAVLASQLKRSNQLMGDTVVVTVMSNLGFHDAMRESGIAVIETPVGDKHVYAAMRDGGYILGGEQSGHIIQMGHATTGDGVLTGLHLLAAVNSIGIPVSAAAKMMTRYPQVLINVRGNKDRAMADPALAQAVSAAKSRLGDAGRVLLRPSGTEPVIRVMVETRQSDVAEQVAGQLADAVRLAMS
jgi:phosphoglucosamine mutase